MSAIFRDAPTGAVLLWRPSGSPVRWWFGDIEGYNDIDFSWNIQEEVSYTFGWSGTSHYPRFRHAPDNSVLFYAPFEPLVRWYGVHGDIFLDMSWHIRDEISRDMTWKVWGEDEINCAWHIRKELPQNFSWNFEKGTGFKFDWHIKTQGSMDFSWWVENQLTRDVAYHVFNEQEQNFSWGITKGLTQDFSYRIFRGKVYSFSWYVRATELVQQFSWDVFGPNPHGVFSGRANPVRTQFIANNLITQYKSSKNKFLFYSDKVLFTFYPYPRGYELEDSVVVNIEEQVGVTPNRITVDDVITEEQVGAVLDVVGSYLAKKTPTSFDGAHVVFQSNSQKLLNQFKSKLVKFTYYSRRGIKYGIRS